MRRVIDQYFVYVCSDVIFVCTMTNKRSTVKQTNEHTKFGWPKNASHNYYRAEPACDMPLCAALTNASSNSMYLVNAVEVHLPNSCIVYAEWPLAAKAEASPLRKECVLTVNSGKTCCNSAATNPLVRKVPSAKTRADPQQVP